MVDVNADAASGPTPELGSGRSDSAGQDAPSRKESGLDKAIAAALGGPEETDVPLEVVKTKMDAEAKGKAPKAKPEAKTKPDAGDKSDGEDARVPEQQAEANPAEAAPKGDAEAREAPKHWPEDRRKAFAAWPKEVQDHALKVDRELQAGFTRKSQELSDQAKYAEQIRGAIDDTVRQQFASAGMDEVAGVRYLTSLQKFATSDPVRYIGWAMQNLGVRPEHLGLSVSSRQQGQQQQQPQGTGDSRLDALLDDPKVTQLSTRFDQAQQRIQQLEAYATAQARQQQQWEQQRQAALQQQHVAHQQSLQSMIDTVLIELD